MALKLGNEGDEEILLHTDLQVWTQDAEGKDQLEPSDDLVISPPVLRIKPKSEQVVRLIMAVPRDPTRQMTYRLLLREEARTVSADEKTARVPIALTLSLPVFVTPKRARHALRCELLDEDPNAPKALCENPGTAHVQFGRLDFLEGTELIASHEGNTYLLAGSRREIALKATTAGQGDGKAGSQASTQAVKEVTTKTVLKTDTRTEPQPTNLAASAGERSLRAMIGPEQTLRWAVPLQQRASR